MSLSLSLFPSGTCLLQSARKRCWGQKAPGSATAQHRTEHGTGRCPTVAGLCKCEIGRVSGTGANIQLSQTAEPLSGLWSRQWGTFAGVSFNFIFTLKDYFKIMWMWFCSIFLVYSCLPIPFFRSFTDCTFSGTSRITKFWFVVVTEQLAGSSSVWTM